MILEKTVSINIVPVNIKYWVSKGYDVKLNQNIEVKVEDLLPNSNIKVRCLCESCNKNYIQRYSRNKSVCGSCILSNRMAGNNFGKNNKNKKSCPSKEQLQQHINDNLTKSKISDIYNVSISVVNRWLKESNIEVPSYFGRLFFKTKQQEELAVTQIENCESDMTISEISKKIAIPRHIIEQLRKKNKVSLETQFDVWKKEYDRIYNNIDHYVKLNEKISLKEISMLEDISLEQLKKVFREKNINVKLHSYNKSKGELECKDFIRDLNINCNSVMLNRTYEIDCFVLDRNFGVEYCGEYWHRYVPSKNNKYYHKNKLEYCEKNNIRLLTIFQNEWENKKDIIKSMIKSRLNLNEKIHARKCEIKEIISSVSNKFHEENHIAGKLNSPINLGLYYNDNLVTVISFIKSRFDKKFQYEISRYSTKKNFVVVGGLSKMFNYFVKKYDPLSCMTYSDLRFGFGKSYEKIGFNLLNRTTPNYYYFKKNGDEMESRLKFQKHKLVNWVNYDSNKSEFDIMEESGYYRLYDCGNNKYGWKKETP